MAVYSQDMYQETKKVKYMVMLTVPLNVLTNSTTGCLSSKHKYVSKKNHTIKKKETNKQRKEEKETNKAVIYVLSL
jgi:hypothetical protein